MPLINIIDVSREAFIYAQSRQLLNQFRKTLEKLKEGSFNGLDLKKREPKSHRVWSFRINKKYRALATLERGNFYIYEIDDHQ